VSNCRSVSGRGVAGDSAQIIHASKKEKMKVGDIIRQTADRYPDKVGVVTEGKEFSWREMNRRVNRMAHGLLGLGLKKGERVAILSRNCHQYLEYYFAIAKAGLVGVPLNILLLPSELSYLINNSGAETLVVDQNLAAKVTQLDTPRIKHFIGLGPGHAYPHDLEQMMRENPDHEPDVVVTESDLFTLAYTSGTTALPKGAMVSHQNSTIGICTIAYEWRLQPDSIYLMHAPMFFAAGGGPRLHAVLRGCRYVIITYEAKTVLQTIEKERITHFSMTPTAIIRLINHPEVREYDLSSVRMIGLVGAPQSVTDIGKIEEVFGHVWCSTYGMTETNVCGTCLQPEEVALDGPLSRRLASVGKALVGMEVRVVDKRGNDIARNGMDMGEVILKGDTLIRGYWNAPEQTREAIKGGWFHSGDLATVDADGYIYIAGRIKDIIISGGVNIVAREIEEVICSHVAVLQCAVIGIPDEEWGETPNAFIVLKAGHHATQDEIIALCKDKLASFKKPKSVHFLDSLPTTSSGKVLKRELADKYGGSFRRTRA